MPYVCLDESSSRDRPALVEHYGDRRTLGQRCWFFRRHARHRLIDNFIPEEPNPPELPPAAEADKLHGKSSSLWDIAKNSRGPSKAPVQPQPGYEKKLMRMGLFTALAIGIHNLPEGLATFLAALEDPQLGVAIAVAIALHNIPEGVSVSVPIYYATGKRRKAFFYSFLSGLAEPVGAGIAYLAILFFAGGPGGVLPPQLTGILFGGVAGIMVYISLDELLPTSRAYGQGHDSLFGLLGGMVVMALSLLLMR
jgi:ZIP family zinc transporter